jgi:hypothetical protein
MGREERFKERGVGYAVHATREENEYFDARARRVGTKDADAAPASL